MWWTGGIFGVKSRDLFIRMGVFMENEVTTEGCRSFCCDLDSLGFEYTERIVGKAICRRRMRRRIRDSTD